MYGIKRVRATNFRSFRDLDFSPENGKVTFLFGENRDEDESSSNGAGKSSIIKAIIWCLIGKTDDGLSSKAYITTGEDHSSAELTLESEPLGEVIVLTRQIGRKKSTKLSVTLNGSPMGELFDVKEVESWLFNKIGVSKEDISNYYLIDQNNPHSFLSATDANKKAIISRIAGFDFLDAKVEKLKEVRSKQESKLSSLAARKIGAEVTINTLKGNIDRMNESIGTKPIVASKEEIALRDSLEKEAEELEERVTLTTSMTRPDEDQVDMADAYVKELKAKIWKRNQRIEQYNSDSEACFRLMKNNSFECSNCAHENVMNASKEKEYEDQVASNRAKVDELTKEKDSLLVVLEDEEKNTKKLRAKFDKDLLKYNKANASIDVLRDLLHQKTSEYNKIASLIKEKEREEESRLKNLEIVKEWESEKKESEESLETISSEISKIDQRILDANHWIKSMSNGGSFRSSLARKTLKAIEMRINQKLEKFRVGMTLIIDGFTEKATGGFSDKIKISVRNSRGNVQPFAAKSGGQKARLNVCAVLAIMDFFNTVKGVEGLDFLVLDEFLDSMDTLGIRAAEKVLVESQVTSIIVSHVVDAPTYAEGRRVVLENGTSSLD